MTPTCATNRLRLWRRRRRLSPSPSMLLFLVLVQHMTAMTQGARVCSSSGMPISKVALDEATGQWILIETEGQFGQGRGRRRRDLFESQQSTFLTGVEVSPMTRLRRINEGKSEYQEDEDFEGEVTPVGLLNETGSFVYMRRCPCNRDNRSLYCSLDYPDCIIPRNNSKPGYCESRSLKQNFIHGSWYVVWGIYSLLVVGAFNSGMGRAIVGYALSLCFPCRNQREVDRMIRDNPDRANWLLRRFVQRARRLGERHLVIFPVNFEPTAWLDLFANGAREERDEEEDRELNGVDGREDDTDLSDGRQHRNRGPPTCLALRTRLYDPVKEGREQQSSSVSKVMRYNDNDEDEFTCSICFMPLETGDRVGSLPCQHIFHVDCLKSWLKRRNKCPLCQQPEIAEPRYDRNHNDNDDDEEGG